MFRKTKMWISHMKGYQKHFPRPHHFISHPFNSVRGGGGGGGRGGRGETFDFLKRRPLTSRAKMIPFKAHTYPPLRIPYISCGPSPKKWNSNKTFFRIKSQKEGRPKSPKFCLKSRCFDFAGLSALSVALPTFFAFIIETHHICIFLLGH